MANHGMLKPRHAVLGFALLLATFGDSWGQSQQQPPPEAQQSQQSQSEPATSQRGTELMPFVVKILPAEKTKPDTEESANASDEETDNEGRLVTATWVLGGIGVLQFLALGFQAFFVARTVTHMRISEGAHVSGGARLKSDDGKIDVLIVTVNNYGKTPASIGTIAATICEEGELNAFPGWGVKTWAGHQFHAAWKGYVFGQIPGQRTDVVFSFQAGKVILGRIWYRDVFKKGRSVGFLLKTDDLTAIGRREFWEEREEADPNE